MDHTIHNKRLAEETGLDLEALNAALDKLGLELAQLGQQRTNYVSTQHDAFLRGVESAEKFFREKIPTAATLRLLMRLKSSRLKIHASQILTKQL